MKTTQAFFVSFIVIVCCDAGRLAAATSWTTLNYPNGVQAGAAAISGNSVVGTYGALGDEQGFVYNTVSNALTTLDAPAAAFGTFASGISGTNTVGYYIDASSAYHGYVNNNTGWTVLDDPSATVGTIAAGIDGNNIVGNYGTATSSPSVTAANGFIYNIASSSWTTIDDPNASYGYGTHPQAISGNDVVGYYYDSTAAAHGFLYNTTTNAWTTLDAPSAALGIGTLAFGISGNNIVGYYYDSSDALHGFLYNIGSSTWTTLDDPLGVQGTAALGIEGATVVGNYLDSSGNIHGFLATVPEPSTMFLLGVGGIGLFMLARCSRCVGKIAPATSRLFD
jgi:hypothetical protein